MEDVCYGHKEASHCVLGVLCRVPYGLLFGVQKESQERQHHHQVPYKDEVVLQEQQIIKLFSWTFSNTDVAPC